MSTDLWRSVTFIPCEAPSREVYNLIAREARVYITRAWQGSDVKVHYRFPGNRLASMTKLRVLVMNMIKRVISYVNYNNVYGRWITTQYLRQIKENSRLDNSGFNKWLEILAGKELQTKLRKTENVDLNSGRATAQRRQTLSTKHRGCKEAATKYYNYTVNKGDEEREHRLPMFQQNAVNRIRNETDEESSRGKFTVKIIRSSMQR